MTLHPFEYTRSTHTAANAHADEAIARLLALHLIQQRGGQLGAGAAERMSQRDGAAADVEPIRIDRQLLQARKHLRGERFVQLDEIDLIQRQPGELQYLADRRYRPNAESFGLDAGRRESDE